MPCITLRRLFEMEKVLVIAEHHKGKLTPAFLATVTAACQIAQQCEVLVIADAVEHLASECAKLQGVAKVRIFSHACFSHLLAENVSQVVFSIAKDYTHILAASTSFGKNFMPRVAAMLDVSQLSDVVKIIDAQNFVRPIYAGNAFESICTHEKIKVLTVRATAFSAITHKETACEIEAIALQFSPSTQVNFEKEETPELSRPELTSAKKVVSGGRGLGSAENFKLIEKIADSLHAAVGASRAAVDAGFVPNDFQVGQTGKIVAPDLYIAVGISGAIQHIAGMKDSKVIVAINKDPEAPIFQIADYGLVGDLFEILPQLEQAISDLKV